MNRPAARHGHVACCMALTCCSIPSCVFSFYGSPPSSKIEYFNTMSTHLRKVPSEAEQVTWMQQHRISTVADLQGGLRDPSSLALLPLYVATKSEVPAYPARAPYRAPGQRDAKRQKTTEAPPKV